MTIQEAKEQFKHDFQNLKGFISVCDSYDFVINRWTFGFVSNTEQISILKVYIDNVEVMKLLPSIYLGYNCKYFIVPDSILPGCD